MFFNTGEISLYYEKHGNKDKTILILPGWGNQRTTFYHIINNFKENYTIYIIDYPGFGNSSIPTKTLTIYDYANIIRNFMEENNIINPIIIAHSFGGRIATLLTGYYKEKIDKLILIDIATIKPKKTWKQKIKQKIYKLLKKGIKLLPKRKQEKYHQKLIQNFGSADYRNLPTEMQETFKNIVNEELKYYLPYIESETLILWGKLDQDTPLKDGIKINNSIKESALIVFPEGNHFCYLQYPILINKIIQEFLKEKTVSTPDKHS